MPKLIRLYITHCAIGFGLAAIFVGMLLWFDIANLRQVVITSDEGMLALLVLWISSGIVFARVQFAIVQAQDDDDDDDDPRGGHRQRIMRPSPQLIPVRVAAGRAQPHGRNKR